MNLEPTNRHLLIQILEKPEEKSESIIHLPSDYKKQESPYALCKVLEVSEDSKFDTSIVDKKIIVERRMIQKIVIDKNEFYLVLENYVLGRLKDEIK